MSLPVGLSRAEVEEALNRLLDDPSFGASARNREFLRFVVTETLEGRGARVKAYTIAIDVFGRPPDFDSSVDPIVRVEASRLRKALSEYYANLPLRPDVRIDLPKGSYSALFERPKEPGSAFEGGGSAGIQGNIVEPTDAADLKVPERTIIIPSDFPVTDEAETEFRQPQPASPGRFHSARRGPVCKLGALLGAFLLAFAAVLWILHAPLPPAIDEALIPVVVLNPVQVTEGDDKSRVAARTIDAALAVALAKFEGIRVLDGADTIARRANSGIPAKSTRSYFLELNVTIGDGSLYLWWRLADGTTLETRYSAVNRVSWSGSSDMRDVISLSQKVAATVAERNGIVRSLVDRTFTDPYRVGFPCITQAGKIWGSGDAKVHLKTRDCLEATVKQMPNNPDAWAFLAKKYADQSRFGFNPRETREELMRKATAAANRALELAPYSSLAHWAAMMVAFERKDDSTFDAEAKRAMEINPADFRVPMYAAVRYWSLEHWEEGLALLQRSIELNPATQDRDYFLFRQENYRKREYGQAVEDFDDFTRTDFYYYQFFAAACYGMLGDKEKAAAALNRLAELRPNFAAEWPDNARRLRLPESYRRALDEGLRKAGLNLPAENSSQN